MMRIDSGFYSDNKYQNLNPKLNSEKITHDKILASQSKISIDGEISKEVPGIDKVVAEIVKGNKFFIDGFNELFDLIKKEADSKFGNRKINTINKNNFIETMMKQVFSMISEYEQHKLSEDLVKLPSFSTKFDKSDPKIQKILDEIDNKFNNLVDQLGKNNKLPGKLTDLIPELESFARLAGVKDKNSFMKQALFRIADKYHNKEISFLQTSFEQSIENAKKLYTAGKDKFEFKLIVNQFNDYTGALHQVFKKAIASYYDNKTLATQQIKQLNKLDSTYFSTANQNLANSDYYPYTDKIINNQISFFAQENPVNTVLEGVTDLLKDRAEAYKKSFDTSSLRNSYWQVDLEGDFGVGQKNIYSTIEERVSAHQDVVSIINHVEHGINYQDGILKISSNLSERDYKEILAKAEEVQDANFAKVFKRLYHQTKSKDTTVDTGIRADYSILLGKNISINAGAKASSEMFTGGEKLFQNSLLNYGVWGNLTWLSNFGIWRLGADISGSLNKDQGEITSLSTKTFTETKTVTTQVEQQVEVQKDIDITVSSKGGDFNKKDDIVESPTFVVTFPPNSTNDPNNNCEVKLFIGNTEVANLSSSGEFILQADDLTQSLNTIYVKVIKKDDNGQEVALSNGGILASYNIEKIVVLDIQYLKLKEDPINNRLTYSVLQTETQTIEQSEEVEKQVTQAKTQISSEMINHFDFYLRAGWFKDWNLNYKWGKITPIVGINGVLGYRNVEQKLGLYGSLSPKQDQLLWGLSGKLGVDFSFTNGIFFNSLLAGNKDLANEKPQISSFSSVGYRHKDPFIFSGIALDVNYTRDFNKKYQNITGLRLNTDFWDSKISTNIGINLRDDQFVGVSIGANYNHNDNLTFFGGAMVEKDNWNLNLGTRLHIR